MSNFSVIARTASAGRSNPFLCGIQTGLLRALMALAMTVFSFCAHAEEGKRYNFGVRPHPLVETPDAAEPAKDEAPKDEAKKEEPKAEAPTPSLAPSPTPETTSVVNGVYSPKNKTVMPSETSPKATHSKGKLAAENSKKAEELVRFFMGSCLKFYGRNKDMVEYMDATFPRLETERKADFAPVIGGTVTTQYWDVVRSDAFYMLAKDTNSGKCDIIAKDGASHAVHKELKAVMDGLTITNILQTKTEYEKVADQNKEVSMVHILGHPLEKELAIVASTKIKDTGDNINAQLTMFTVPQETVEVIETGPKPEAPAPSTPAAAGGGFSKD